MGEGNTWGGRMGGYTNTTGAAAALKGVVPMISLNGAPKEVNSKIGTEAKYKVSRVVRVSRVGAHRT